MVKRLWFCHAAPQKKETCEVHVHMFTNLVIFKDIVNWSSYQSVFPVRNDSNIINIWMYHYPLVCPPG